MRDRLRKEKEQYTDENDWAMRSGLEQKAEDYSMAGSFVDTCLYKNDERAFACCRNFGSRVGEKSDMIPGKKIELLIYSGVLFVLVGMEFILRLDIAYEEIDTLLLFGVLIYLFTVINVIRGKWKYLGLISAFMVWTGIFCVFSSFFSIIDNEGLFSIVYNTLYAFCGVFGGIRMYRAWLARNKSMRDEQA